MKQDIEGCIVEIVGVVVGAAVLAVDGAPLAGLVVGFSVLATEGAPEAGVAVGLPVLAAEGAPESGVAVGLPVLFAEGALVVGFAVGLPVFTAAELSVLFLDASSAVVLAPSVVFLAAESSESLGPPVGLLFVPVLTAPVIAPVTPSSTVASLVFMFVSKLPEARIMRLVDHAVPVPPTWNLVCTNPEP